MDKIRIKTYGRMELAQIYFPTLVGAAAWRKLKQWIDICKPLREDLDRLGYNAGRRSFTPAEVAAIFKWIGEP